MRIGMMLDVYKPHTSGITHTVSLYKQFFEQAGHQVFVFTFGNLDYPDDETNVIRSPGIPLGKTDYFFSWTYSARAKALVQSMDIVHIHHPFLSGRMALRYCRPQSIPMVFTNHTRHDIYMKTYLPYVPDLATKKFLRSYLSSFFNSIDLVVAPSKGLSEVLSRLGIHSSIQVIPNGVDLHFFKNAHSSIDRSKFGFHTQDVILAYMGRVAPEKNLSFLLQAYSRISQEYPQVKLMVIGGGPELGALEKEVFDSRQLAGRVVFTGMVPYQEIPAYLDVADVFVTASVSEVHPLSLIEAMAAGLPVLGIASPGISDIIRDRQNGLLSPFDLKEFISRMRLIISDLELRRMMGQQARIDAEDYAIERTGQLLIEHYQRLVARDPRQRKGLRNTFGFSWTNQ